MSNKCNISNSYYVNDIDANYRIVKRSYRNGKEDFIIQKHGRLLFWDVWRTYCYINDDYGYDYGYRLFTMDPVICSTQNKAEVEIKGLHNKDLDTVYKMEVVRMYKTKE